MMLNKLEDTELVKKLQDGNKEAFNELFIRYNQKAFHLALRFSKNEADAEEIIQEVFLNVFRKIKKFEGKSAFSSWLYRITVNTALMKLRKKPKNCVVMQIDEDVCNTEEFCFDVNSSNNQTNYLTIRHELRGKLEVAIKNLPTEYKDIFILRDVDGLSNQEVGDILNISIPAVKSRLHRARLLLKKGLMKYYKDYTNQDMIFDGNLKLVA
jgi:RNA polymerase sigma-70 factor (ECF subfamily)